MSEILSSRLHCAFIYYTFRHITYKKNITAWQEIRHALLSFLCQGKEMHVNLDVMNLTVKCFNGIAIVLFSPSYTWNNSVNIHMNR